MKKIQIGITTTSIGQIENGVISRWIDGELNTNTLSCESLHDVERMVRAAYKRDGMDVPRNIKRHVIDLWRQINKVPGVNV